MIQPASAVSALLYQLVQHPESGVNARLRSAAQAEGYAEATLSGEQVSGSSLSVEAAEKDGSAIYPALNIYCEKVINSLEQKFRTFSGTVHAVVEVRLTSDHPDQLANITQRYTNALAGLLADVRGKWGQGIYYPGTYELTFSAIRRGGKNYIQTAKFHIQVQVNS